MNTLEAIAARRSIRKFTDDPVPDEIVRKILNAGIQAPSGKNHQPWRFVVVRGDGRGEMIRLMRAGIAAAKGRGDNPGSSEWTTEVMAVAPVTVFVFHPDGIRPWLKHSTEQNFSGVVDVQSIGAAIQNMLLAAADLGVGSLWICDVFYAYEELCDWLGEEGALIAAVSFGHADEHPDPRPRSGINEVARWV